MTSANRTKSGDCSWNPILSAVGGLCLLGALLEAGPVGAQAGGLPACQASLRRCQGDLVSCQGELATCVVFPGDGLDGPALSYTANGDGTATDNNTLLMWEVKGTTGGVHNVNTTYTWTGDGPNGSAANGTLFTVFLATLNTTCSGDETRACTSNTDCTGLGNGTCGHAGYRDWRIPNVKELQSLVKYLIIDARLFIDPSFPGSTAMGQYWSFTSRTHPEGADAWAVEFDSGSVFSVLVSNKPVLLHARAVRGGR